jgi:two-component system cell cycle sensor histidine kinase/response regulator CckA
MVQGSTRILLVEDNPLDVRIIKEILPRGGESSFELTHADRLSKGIEILAAGGIDVVLLDLNLPDSRGLDTFDTVLAQGMKVPIVIISGVGDETVALEALKRGAQDYLVKGELSTHIISRSIRYAIERKQIEEELKKAREELEQRVADRTAELAVLNEELKKEIVEKQRAEQVLRESEEKWRNLFENSIEAVFTLDLSGKITSVNRAGQDLTGYTRDEMTGKNALRFVKPVERRFTRGLFLNLFETGEPIATLTYTLVTKDGQERTVEGYVNVIKKDNKTIGFQGTLRDITDKLRLEGQIAQTQKMEAVAALAGGMAHNFNNILVGIMGYAEYLLAKRDEGDPDYKALSTIYEGAVRASELTRQLLNTARGGQYHPRTLNLNDVIKKFLPLIQGTFNKSIEIRTNLAADLYQIEGDVGQLEQCLLNLAINARDAMGSEGVLTIETKNRHLDARFVRDHMGVGEGDYVVLSVSDTGHGIPATIQGRIFEPFFTTKESKGGTGMGLCSVYGIVKNHRGVITVTSEVKKGATFTIYLPVAKEKAQGVPLSELKNEKGKNELILLIDDELIVREMWSDFLKTLGYRVITAQDGKEGVAIVEQNRDGIDLVILDLIMPRLGGRETLEKIREIKPDVKVIITSGYSEYERARDLFGEKTIGFIPKPSQLREISEKVREALDKKAEKAKKPTPRRNGTR